MANLSGAVDWLTKNANDIATRISGSQWAKHVLPGFQQLQQEAGEKVATNINSKARINGVIRGAIDVGGLMGGAISDVRGGDASVIGASIASRVMKDASDTNADDVIEALFKEYQDDYKKIFESSGNIDESVQKAKDAVKRAFRSHVSGPYAAPDAHEKIVVNASEAYASSTPLQKGKALGAAYFNPTDKDAKFARIATAAGAYMGVATVGRVMNGGTLTQDSYGRKNLVGIPFI